MMPSYNKFFQNLRVTVILVALSAITNANAAPLQKGPVVSEGLLLDLNPDIGVVTDNNGRIEKWTNSVAGSVVKDFEKVDEGREVKGSGKPTLLKKVQLVNGHNTVQFIKHELLNRHETAFDTINRGSGFTWVAVIRPYNQVGQLQDVNSFFGNLRNGGNYEGFWAGFTDDNRVWTGLRNGITFGRWDENNPCVRSEKKLDTARFYLLAGRMESGTSPALIELFIDDFSKPDVTGMVPVNVKADPSMMAIGQERNAIEHPGVESFIGEMARIMIYQRPLTNDELHHLGVYLRKLYFKKR